MLQLKLKKNTTLLSLSISLLAFLFSSNVFSQGATCESVQPFCADAGSTGITFKNTSDGSTAQVGPDYSCLATQPNAAWYYFQIGNGGNLDLTISQNTQTDGLGTELDVDFIIWGPFNTTAACTASDLSSENIVDCSYLPDTVEYASIPNTVSGDIYIIVITNFDGRPGYITLETTPGGATTDCSIVVGNLGEDITACEGETILLDGTTTNAASYSWTKDGTTLTNETNATLNVTTSGTYQVTATDGNGNSGTDEIVVTFTEKPSPNAVNDITLCSNDKDATGKTVGVFNLSQTTTTILGSMPASSFIVTYHTNQEDADMGVNAIPENYTNTVANKQVFVRVENVLNDNCADTSISFNLILNSNTETEIPASLLMACSDNGFAAFNLEDADLRSLTPTATISYYQTINDLLQGTNAITNVFTNTIADTQTVYAKIENEGSCFVTAELVLVVDALPSVSLEETIAICLDENGIAANPAIINTGLSTTEYSFIWERNGVILTEELTENLQTTIEGDYTVTVTDLTTGCQIDATTKVVGSSAPLNVTIDEISSDFGGENNVTVITEGFGDYVYQANGGEKQTSPVFTNLPSGNNTITVSSTYGCGEMTIKVFLVDYPRFFTPNGDNVNDTWNMPNIELLRNASISIYNSYGNMITVIKTNELGWDGTLNGKQLQETDYWFNMTYVEGNTTKQVKGHFSLKR